MVGCDVFRLKIQHPKNKDFPQVVVTSVIDAQKVTTTAVAPTEKFMNKITLTLERLPSFRNLRHDLGYGTKPLERHASVGPPRQETNVTA